MLCFQVCRARPANEAVPETQDPGVLLAVWDQRDNPVPMETLVNQASLAQTVNLVSLVPKDSPDQLETVDFRVRLDRGVWLEILAPVVLQVNYTFIALF